MLPMPFARPTVMHALGSGTGTRVNDQWYTKRFQFHRIVCSLHT